MRPAIYQHGDMRIKLDEIEPCGYYSFRFVGEPKRFYKGEDDDSRS
jgi:hypothetical protein